MIIPLDDVTDHLVRLLKEYTNTVELGNPVQTEFSTNPQIRGLIEWYPENGNCTVNESSSNHPHDELLRMTSLHIPKIRGLIKWYDIEPSRQSTSLYQVRRLQVIPLLHF